MKNAYSVILALVALMGCQTIEKEAPIAVALSPDGRNSIRLYMSPCAVEVLRDGKAIVPRSRIALKVDGKICGGDERPVAVNGRALSGKVAMDAYKKAEIDLSGAETFADFGDFGVRLAARDDGVAYRFELKRSGEVTVNDESFDLALPEANVKALVYRTGTIGCEEQIPKVETANQLRTDKGQVIYLPLVFEQKGTTVAISESDLYDYPILNFERGKDEVGNVLKTAFARYPSRVHHGGKEGARGRHQLVDKREDYLVKTQGSRSFPWRTFAMADNPSNLVGNDLVTALAREQAKYDFSWVKPGKVAWDWWNAFDNIGDPEGCTTATYRRFIDFAVASKVEYVIFDEGWSEALNIWKFHPNVDVPALIKYATERGVGIILWMAWDQVVGDEARVAEEFAKLGVKGFKVDFMDRGDAAVERFLWTFADECAKRRLVVDYHGAHRPTGMSRAYPNVLNYEGIHGLEAMKWFKNHEDNLFNDVACVFGRLSAGPMDFTPGAMDNYPIGAYPYDEVKGDNRMQNREWVNPGSTGTRVHQMAMMVAYEAPLQMLCDAPTKYEKNMESFKFMASVPVVWKDSLGLGGCPETYVALARQAKDGAWYVAVLNNREAREIELDLSFLGQGAYNAEVFEDAADAQVVPSHYVHTRRYVKPSEKLKVKLAAGGGWVARIEK